MYKQVVSRRLSDKIVEEILNMVSKGVLKPGDKIPNETELAEQFGVSRGVLREALTTLQAQGYIRRKPKNGTYIQENIHSLMMSRSVDDLLMHATHADLIEFRSALEEHVVVKAIERASDEEIEALFDILEPSDKEGEDKMDYYFHYKLAEISRNTFYMNFIDTYYDLIDEIAKKSLQEKERKKMVEQEHLAIVKAIAARDKKAAVKAIRTHLEMVNKSYRGTP